jgi:pyrroloquinoline quinone biosynthesis protein B
LREAAPFASSDVPDGIFLTHAHIGHYTGLMYTGKEAMDTKGVPVHCLPDMASFLKNNGPWEQLVTRQNIRIQTLSAGLMESIAPNVTVTPVLVPHRDEYSETAGFIIRGPERSALFIPDIDKWEKWEQDILSLIREVDYAFLDGTFYDGTEVPGRDIREIPHPFVTESMQLFEALPMEERAKIHFIHFNHTNPLLDKRSDEYKSVLKKGFGVASTGQTFRL